jgi:hypothetical protein
MDHMIEDCTWMRLLSRDSLAVSFFSDARLNESVQEILYVPGFESIVENSVSAAQFSG